MIIHEFPPEGALLWDAVATDWEGHEVAPPVEYSFQLDAAALTFHARRLTRTLHAFSARGAAILDSPKAEAEIDDAPGLNPLSKSNSRTTPVESGRARDRRSPSGEDGSRSRNKREKCGPGPAHCHPEASAGRFQPELWKFDVAEFFLTDPVRRHYLEVNLSPNGAHWCCEFTAPRQALREHREAGLRSFGAITAQGWSAQVALPRPWLEEQFHFGPQSRLNATFILESPRQRFLTASPLPGPGPDFHQPAAFLALIFHRGS